jgi:hypothetical protein
MGVYTSKLVWSM